MQPSRLLSIRVLLVGVLLLSAAPSATAAPVTYTERIEDLNFGTLFDLFDLTRDLTRTRTFGDGTSAVETDTAAIAGENLLSDNWGLSTLDAFGWTHIFVPSPPVGTFLQATLTLEVIGVDGFPDLGFPDFVFVEGFLVGVLTPGGLDVQTTSLFSTAGLPDPGSLIALVLADGRLDVAVLPLLLDFMTIRSSTLDVTYVPVPEPASAMLLMGGLAAGGAWRRRRCPRSE